MARHLYLEILLRGGNGSLEERLSQVIGGLSGTGVVRTGNFVETEAAGHFSWRDSLGFLADPKVIEFSGGYELPPLRPDSQLERLRQFADDDEIFEEVQASFGAAFYSIKATAPGNTNGASPGNRDVAEAIDVLHFALNYPLSYAIGYWRLCSQSLDLAWSDPQKIAIRLYGDRGNFSSTRGPAPRVIELGELALVGYLRASMMSNDVPAVLKRFGSWEPYFVGGDEIGRFARIVKPVRWFSDGSARFFVYDHRPLSELVLGQA